MKNNILTIILLLAVILFVGCSKKTDDEKANSVKTIIGEEITLRDYDATPGASAFSFKSGGFMNPEDMGDVFLGDIFFDMPHGLGTNSKELGEDEFTGSAGIIDMGKVSINKVFEAPMENYKPALTPDEIKVGHTYCCRTADGQHYGKIEILEFQDDRSSRNSGTFLKFIWQYHPKKGCRTFTAPVAQHDTAKSKSSPKPKQADGNKGDYANSGSQIDSSNERLVRVDSGTSKSTLFQEEVKDYIKSGSIFRSIWNNFSRVVLVRELAPGTFFAVVDYKEGGGRQSYEILSFEFPTPKKVVSKIREVGGTTWSAEVMDEKEVQALGLIIAIEQDCSDPREFWRGAYCTKNGGWFFNSKYRGGYWRIPTEIAKGIYGPSPYLQNKYLGKKEIEFSKSLQKFTVRKCIDSTYVNYAARLTLEGCSSNLSNEEFFEGKWGDGVEDFNKNSLQKIVGTEELIKGEDIYVFLERDTLIFYYNKLYGACYHKHKDVGDTTRYVEDTYNATSEKYINAMGEDDVRWVVSDEVYVKIKESQEGGSFLYYFYKPIGELVVKKYREMLKVDD